MTPKPRNPTASGISRLLAAAGFERAEIKMRGGHSGFAVKQDFSGSGVVVRHKFWAMGGHSPEQYREWLDRYAKAITGVGWSVKTGDYTLIVTTRTEEPTP